MPKFYGKIGYAETTETGPGVWTESIIEKDYYGDILRNTRTLVEGDKLNNGISVNNSFSIVADAYANQHFFAIRYIEWAGARWTVKSVEVKSPRLLLQVGELYNGETPSATVDP